MNQSYRLVWSAVRGAWAVVSELTKSHAKSVVMASVVIAAVVPMQVQAVLISSGDLSVQDLKVGHLASTGVTEFEVGGTFGMASTNFAVLKASGTGSMVDLGGGTYHLSTASGGEAAIESLGDFGKGGIDFSKANKVTLTTGQRAGLQASKGGHIQLSELDLTHSHSSGMANVASVLSQDEGSTITIRKAKIENSTSGVGIESLNGGEIIINELAYASTNVHSGLLLTGTKNSQMTIGSLTGAQSRINNGNGNLITVNAKAATLMLNHVEVTGNAANTTKLMHMTGGNATTANRAVINNQGDGSAISLAGAGTTLSLTDSSVDGHTSSGRKLVELFEGSMVTAHQSSINNAGTGTVIGLDGVGTTGSLTESSVEGNASGSTKLMSMTGGSVASINKAAIKNNGSGTVIGLAGVGTTLNLTDSSVEGRVVSTAALTRQLIDLSTGSMATINNSTINNHGKGIAINLAGTGTGLTLTDSSVESKGSGLNLGMGVGVNGATATLNNSTITSADNGIAVSIAGTLNLTDSKVSTTGDFQTAVVQGGLGNQLNLAGNNTLIALGERARGLVIHTGTVTVADGANTTILTTDDMAWLMDAAILSSTETAQVSYMINTGEGDVAAIQFADKSLIQLGALSQKITVNTGQEQGLLVANSGVEIGRLNLTQIRAKNKGEAIQLSNDGLLHVKELVLNSTQKGITIDFSTLRIGDVSTPSTVTVTGDDHKGIAATNVSHLFLTQTTVETNGARSDAINVADLSVVQFDGINNIITKGTHDAIGLKVGTESTVRFSGTNNISTVGTNSTALLLETSAASEGVFTGTVTTTGANAVGIQSSVKDFALAKSTVTTSGEGSTGVLLTGGSATLVDNRLATGGNDAVAIKVSTGSAVEFSGINNLSTAGERATGLLLEEGATAKSGFTGMIETTGANAAGIVSAAANLNVIGSTLMTSGVGSMGMHLVGGNTILTDNTIATNANDAVGVKVAGVSGVNFDGSNNISTAGNHSTGLLLEEGATVTGTLNGIIFTSGINAVGILSAAANLELANSRVTTTGKDSIGLSLQNGRTVLTDNTVITNGSHAVGVQIGSASTVVFAGTNNISTSGEHSTALLLKAGAVVSGPLSGKIAAHNADTLVFEGNSLNAKPLQLKEATLTSPKNAILLKAGHLLVSATDSVMTGDIKAQKGAVLDLNLIGSDVTKSVLTGAILNARNVSIDPSTWDITAHSDIVNLSNDGSDFRFVNKNGTAPTAAYSDFKTVTVKNYTGLNDAHIYLNTRLNGDDVTGAGSDKIVVRDGGLMSGTTTFHFANAGGAGAATYDGIQFVEAKGSATVDKSQMKIAGGYVVAGAYGYVGRQGQYTHSADNQSLFLTNFVPKGATVDGHGFLTGGVGVTPQKSAEVASGSGTGVGGHFSEAPTDGTSTGNRHIDKQGHSVCDNGSTSAGCLLPVTNRAGNAIIYTSELDSTGKTDDVTVTETGEVLPSKPNTKLAKILTKTPNLDSKSKVVPDSHLDSKSGLNVPVVAPIQPAPKSLISPDFVTYNAAADVVSLSANTLLGSYHERMGAQNTPLIQAEKATSYNPNSWGRLVADTREVAYGNAAFDQSVKGKTTGFQMGHSFWQHRNPDHALGQAGVAVGYVTGKMDVTGDFLTTQQGEAGSIKAKTKSLMAYYTLATDKGTYLDTVLQYSMSNTDAKGQQSNVSLDAKGLRASLEVGVPVYFDSLTLELQAQTIAYKDSFDDAIDSNGYVMSQGDNQGVISRLGLRLESNSDSAFKPWFAANVNMQNGSSGTGVMDKTNNVGLNSEKDAKWADMSVGLSYQTSADFSVYGHLKQSVAIGGGTNTTTSGAIGVQKTW